MSDRTSERACGRSRRYCPRKGTIRGSAGAPVGAAPPLELVEAFELGGVERDDELAAALDRDVVALAERVELRRAVDAQPRLERPRRVVDAGVDDAAVVAGLVRAELGLAVDHGEAEARVAPQQ